jgi:hypothetical protein
MDDGPSANETEQHSDNGNRHSRNRRIKHGEIRDPSDFFARCLHQDVCSSRGGIGRSSGSDDASNNRAGLARAATPIIGKAKIS